jgi:hypothetical protein
VCGQGEAGSGASGRLEPQLRLHQAGQGKASACGQGEAGSGASERLQPQLRRLLIMQCSVLDSLELKNKLKQKCNGNVILL